VRELFNAEWVFAFQNHLREAVNLYFGEVEEWPFLKGYVLRLMAGKTDT
jgi:hypothetical protein